MAEFGYAGKILKVDLSGGGITTLPTAAYAEKFLGGRGIAAGLFWEMVPPSARAYDPDNCLVCVTGPVMGFTRLAGCRWQVCGKTAIAEPETFSYANLGDRWGSRLKYAGFDGLAVQGKAEKPVYLLVRDAAVEIKDAAALWGRSSFEAADSLKAEWGKDVSVLTIGPAAENLVAFATLITDDGASGGSGLGAVMGSKNLKAIVVAGAKRPVAADPARLDAIADHLSKIRKDTWKNWLDDIPGKTTPRPCYGCTTGCFRKAYETGGRRYKFFCQAVHVYWNAAQQSRAPDWQETALLATRLCDRYGLDTTVVQPMIEWLARCFQEGILNDNTAGLPLSRIGGAEFIEAFTRKVALREGFGDALAQGTLKAAAQLGGRALELARTSVLTRASETKDYDPRLVLTNALLYATEPRRPINQVHELTHALWMWRNKIKGLEGAFLTTEDFITIGKNFWGGAAAADFSTCEGKALAAKKIQDRAYAKESSVLCDFLWPVIWVRFADDHTGDPSLESQVISAVTGREIDTAGFNLIGERVFNLQRAIFSRQGWGSRSGDRLLDYLHDEPLEGVFFDPDCIVPGPNGKIVSRKGARIDRRDFEDLKSEYYALRGWDIASGVPTEAKLRELDLVDVAADLKARGLTG
jgi:aldehyde:ferredoxin oxidoreductase